MMPKPFIIHFGSHAAAMNLVAIFGKVSYDTVANHQVVTVPPWIETYWDAIPLGETPKGFEGVLKTC